MYGQGGAEGGEPGAAGPEAGEQAGAPPEDDASGGKDEGEVIDAEFEEKN